VQLIKHRKWNTLDGTLLEDLDLTQAPYKFRCCSSCKASHGLLNGVLMYQPPVKIVRKIVENLPALAYDINCIDHFPFHTALSHGCNINVVNYLIGRNNRAVQLIDREGKNQLHLAIDGYEKLYLTSNYELSSINDNVFQVLNTLYNIEPSNVMKTDSNDMDVIEYALEKEIDYDIIIKLQKLTADYVQRQTERKNNGDSKNDRNKSSEKSNIDLKNINFHQVSDRTSSNFFLDQNVSSNKRSNLKTCFNVSA